MVSATRLLVVVFVVLVSSPCWAQSVKPEYPVIFIHGLSSNADASWGPFREELKANGWVFGGRPMRTSQGVVIGVEHHPADFYAMNFSDWDAQEHPATTLTIDAQAREVDAVVKDVLSENPTKQKVILIGHSMGGLAARAYVQSYGSIQYGNDVERLITIGTPHLGSAVAEWCVDPGGGVGNFIIDAICNSTLGGLESAASVLLRPGSVPLRHLNSTLALPQGIRYTAIVGRVTDFELPLPASSGDRGDGIVSRESQVFLAAFPNIEVEAIEVDLTPQDACGKYVGTRVERHTCETSDRLVWAKLLRLLKPSVAASAPTATTGDVAAPSQTTATVSATTNPNGAATTLVFEYGVATAYGNLVSLSDIAAATITATRNRLLPNLDCNTVYHYRVRALNSVGSSSPGVDQTFTTAACAATSIGELLTNGPFTATNSGWDAQGHFFYDSRVNVCRQGSCPGYAYLSNENRLAADNLSGTLSQTVTIPSAISSAELSFWYHIESVDDAGARDVLRVTLRSSTGSILSTIANLSNLDRTTGYVRLSRSVLEHAGRRVTVHFEATTDGNNRPTTFRIDDVSLVVVASTAPPSSAPTAETGGASSQTDSTARLSAAVNPNGDDTRVFLDYGVAGVGGNTKSLGSIGAGQAFVNVTADLNGLSCGTRYFYRARAENDHGSRTGSQEEFRTSDCGYAIISLSGNLQFGEVPVGSSVTSVVTITNLGSTPLTVDAWTLWFGFRRTTVPPTIPPGESRTVNITFAPPLLLDYGGTLVLDGPNAIRRNTLPLAGKGVFTGTYFYSDVEADFGIWSSEGPWGPFSKAGYNGTRGWATGTYANNANAKLAAFPVNLSQGRHPLLKFRHRRGFADDGFDSGNVLVSTDGGATFTRVMQYFGSDSTWRETTIDLTPFVGQTSVQIYFQILSDAGATGDGWWIDEISVLEDPTASDLPGKPTGLRIVPGVIQ